MKDFWEQKTREIHKTCEIELEAIVNGKAVCPHEYEIYKNMSLISKNYFERKGSFTDRPEDEK
jgi:hypothetical protein